VWDGFLARGRITLLGALPKCGKTTLLTHLLKAHEAGGTFCGRALTPGSAVVVTEESPDEWAQRRNALGLTDAVRVLPRPFFGKPSYEEWLSFLTHLIAHFEQHPADVVILDTLADLWPAKDENSAVEVHAALQPLRKLADGRAVVCVHHLRKSDGGEGTAARGSGALVGFVDVIAELRRAPKATDPHGRRRVLKGYGRMTGIPDEWMIEMAEDGTGFTHVDADAAATDTHERQEDGRKDELRAAILGALTRHAPTPLTREELWEELPPDMRKNEKRFRAVLEDGTGTLWQREGKGRNGGAFRYWWEPSVTHPGEEEGGEGG
jgi:predicted ATP-dependent serine protease